MIVICPTCGKRHRLPEDWSANKVRCSRCGAKFYLDELPPEFITADVDSHEKAQEAQKPASSIGEHSRPSRSDSQAQRSSEIALPYQSRLVTSSATILRVAVGIVAVFVIAGATAFYFLHVVPENKFRQAMRKGQEAENAGRWDDALNAYFRAERIKPRDAGVAGAWHRVLEKQRLAEYTEAMVRGKAAEQLKNWETALREYQTALLRKSDDAAAKASAARAQYQLRMKEGREAEQQKRWDMALIAYSHALAVKTGDADATTAMRRVEYLAAMELGQKAEAIQKWDDAAMAYRKAWRLKPNDEAATDAIERLNARLAGNLVDVKPAQLPLGKTITVHLEWTRQTAERHPEMSAKVASPVTQLSQHILMKSGAAKIALSVIPEVDGDAWAFARKQERVSGDSKKLYQLLGEQLLAADHLLQSADLAQRKRGLAMAIQAGRGARRLLNDAELASAIADAFLLPNVKQTADEKPYVWLSRSNVIEEAIAAYQLAGDKARQAAAYQMLLEFAPNRNTADFARVRLAELSQQMGNHCQALEYLKAVEPGSGGMSAARRLIPGIEKKLQLQSRKDGGTQ